MTVVAFRTRQISSKSNVSAISTGTVLAVVGALAMGAAAAVIGHSTHQGWQATLSHYATLPGKPAVTPVQPVSPARSGFGA